jgi:hypothetical protein
MKDGLTKETVVVNVCDIGYEIDERFKVTLLSLWNGFSFSFSFSFALQGSLVDVGDHPPLGSVVVRHNAEGCISVCSAAQTQE